MPALTTPRQFALEAGVARTTRQYWLARKDARDADPAVIALFESPAGLAVLHRMVGAAHRAFTQVGPCGIRLVSMFLELSHLDRCVASSRGAQQGVSTAMPEVIVAFGRQPREDVAQAMRPETITVCQDETCHPETCLVALESTHRDQVAHAALAGADLFQRSRACVEGRNGPLALRHHRLHRLGGRTLEALTIVHNFFIRRSDATTAAERFFGAQPADMFAWVLDHLDVPARPARARSKARLVAA